jgi:hypothetical protein
MKKSTLKQMLFLSFVLLCFGINAQNNALWTKASNAETQTRQKAFRTTMPQDFNLYSLQTAAFKNLLVQAPARNSGHSNVIVNLPTNEGKVQAFRVYEASVMAPALQAQHPNIRSYVAQGIDDPSALARFSVSDIGVNIMISSPNFSTVYVDPYTQDKNYYISYNISELPADPNGFECMVEEGNAPALPIGASRDADDGTLRTFRAAVACTGEYAQYHLNQQGVDPGETDAVKKAAVLSAMNVTMTRVDGVYERDLAVTMVLVPNQEDIIYLNPSTDPFTNNNASVLINQSQTVIDAQIGSANYDIGHTFSTGAGGLAQLRVPCTGSKARGVTGTNAPIGDFYDIDFVAHEMGHQFGANHTFNSSCGNNRNNGTAMEPGSGTTIMGYAGVCAPYNVQAHSDDYFHAISLAEMWSNITQGNSQCGAQSATNNNPPTADAGPDMTIPKSTPFILKGVASDPDSGDVLSHCWEQMNPQVAPMPPVSTSTTGPAFRSIDPLPTSERFMPQIVTVINGGVSNTWEVVPSVSRNMSFRYTVRDNAVAGGSTASDNMVVSVDGGSGPFVVTSQSGPTTWQTGTTETVTWDVAGTDVAPVNSPNVDIFFSTDNGFTYPITVALNVPNNGSAVVNVPNLNTTAGKLMVRSSSSLFYQLNEGKITVTGTVGNEDFTFDSFAVYPNPSNGTFNISFKPASNDDVQLSLYDLRGRLINQYNYDDVSTSGLFSKQLDYSYIDSGMYFLVVKNGNKTSTKKLMKI